MLLLLIGLSACSTTKKADKYGYLLDKNSRKTVSGTTYSSREPFMTIDIAVLDTVGKRPVVPDSPPIVVNKPKPRSKPAPEKEVKSTKVTKRLIKTAHSYIGTPYKYGGTSRKGIDCSGLVFLSYQSVKRKVPRSSSQLSKTGKVVKKGKISPGDLVFFSTGNGSRINHVGMVTKVRGREVTFIHATVSRGVREDTLDDGYWSKRYRKARRI
ncbi:MAG: C40 family peptidase [Bacteroidota bacterium]